MLQAFCTVLQGGKWNQEKAIVIDLSVIIPTYNRAERLRVCLGALARQTQPASEFEVIVVVDGSTDDTGRMLSSINTPFALNVLFQENKGQNVARNHGVEFAQGRYCLFLDDDIVAEPELIAEHLHLHRQHEKAVGIGRMSLKIPRRSNWFMHNYARGWDQHYELLNQGVHKPDWLDCYGGNISVSRSVFLEAGGFALDIRRSHDVEFGYRLEQHGVTFVYLPRALGTQDEHKDIREVIADAEKAGTAWITLCQRHPAMYPHLLEGLVQTGLRESWLREMCWRFGVSPVLLARVGGLFGSTARARKWFRFINQYSYWRGVRRAIPCQNDSPRLMQGTPILMYHAFGQRNEAASRFVLPIKRFASQMAWLKRLGYCVLSLDEYLQYQRQQLTPPARSVVITIDDGYSELRRLVYPVLHRHGFVATVFIVTGKIGTHNDWASGNELSLRQLLSRDEIQEMSQSGIRFGAHSRTHVSLVTISPEQVQEEIAGSKADLESILQTPITSFAYPYGEFDLTIQAIVERAGFAGACGANSGLNIQAAPLFALHRIEIEGTCSLPRFLLALWLGCTS